ncbi:MAG: hypothetical protein HY815_05125 [Candidatus Riflebacteria bacterium]|nr:hypothetical protein [Candidatus Riflebacteria bacterium]
MDQNVLEFWKQSVAELDERLPVFEPEAAALKLAELEERGSDREKLVLLLAGTTREFLLGLRPWGQPQYWKKTEKAMTRLRQAAKERCRKAEKKLRVTYPKMPRYLVATLETYTHRDGLSEDQHTALQHATSWVEKEIRDQGSGPDEILSPYLGLYKSPHLGWLKPYTANTVRHLLPKPAQSPKCRRTGQRQGEDPRR